MNAKLQNKLDALLKKQSIGHAVNLGPVQTKTKFFAIKPDKAFKDCYLVLINFLGSAMWVRYPKYLVRMFS